MKLVTFTNVDGSRVVVNADCVTRIRTSHANEFSGDYVVIEFLGGKQAVKEDFDTVHYRLTS